MLTTLMVGAQLYDNFLHGLPAFTLGDELMPLFHPKWIWQQPSQAIDGNSFLGPLMAILLAHEFGHFLLLREIRSQCDAAVFHSSTDADRNHGGVYPDQVSHPFAPGAVRHWSGRPDCGLSWSPCPCYFSGWRCQSHWRRSWEWRASMLGSRRSFTLRTGSVAPASAQAVPLEPACPASNRGGRLGGNVRHRPESAARRPTRRGPHYLRGCASGAQMGDPGDRLACSHLCRVSGSDGWFGP